MLRARPIALVALWALLGAPALGGEGPPAAPPRPPATRESVLQEGLAALRARMEARLQEVAILRAAGRADDALRAIREIERLHAEGWEDLRRLVDGTAPRLPPADGSDLLEPYAAYDPLPRGHRPFGRRGLEVRRTGGGGVNPVERAIGLGLAWLRAHQSPDGAWRPAELDRWCDGAETTHPPPDGRGKPGLDVGATALALCAYLGAGYTWRGNDDHVRTVARAVGFLRARQRGDGGFSPRAHADWILEDAFAALALVEAYGMTGQQSLRLVAQRALDHLASIRTPAGVWGYGWAPGPSDDPLTSAWAALPFVSARYVNDAWVAEGLTPPWRLDPAILGAVAAWYRAATDEALGPFAPRPFHGQTAADALADLPATAANLALPVLTRTEVLPAAERRKIDAWLTSHAPRRTSATVGVDLTACSLGALAAFRVGGDAMRAWRSAFHAAATEPTALLAGQATEGLTCTHKGSWAPQDPAWADWGRLGSTVLMTLVLESTFDRYAPAPDAPEGGR